MDRGHVEAARLQHQRDDRQPGQQVVRRRLGRLPEAVMGRQVAIACLENGRAGAARRP